MIEKRHDVDRCDCNVIHEEIVNQVKAKMPLEKNCMNLLTYYKVFGDSRKIRILRALDESEMCVCDISVLLNMTQSAISHQLRVLRQARLMLATL